MDARISYYEPILALAKAKEEKAFALQKSWPPASKPEMTKRFSILACGKFVASFALLRNEIILVFLFFFMVNIGRYNLL